MNSVPSPPGSPDPDDVLKEHTRQLTREYRARLAEVFVDPNEAGRRFYSEASRRSPADAALLMRDDPARFGTSREGTAAAAAEAAILGARAYHSRLAEGEPRLGAALLDQLLNERIVASGADRDRVRSTWDALSKAYGVEEAATLFVRRAREALGSGADPGAAAEVARLAAARDGLRERASGTLRLDHTRSLPLPRSLDDLAAHEIPGWAQQRLLAASDGLRKRLGAAYTDPLAAEARLHQAFDQYGTAALDELRRHPPSISPLRTDLPGGAPQAAASARSAIKLATVAFEYHHARAPEDLERLRAREAFREAKLGARDVEAAMESVQEGIQLTGPALDDHLRRKDRGIGRGGPEGGRGGLDGAAAAPESSASAVEPDRAEASPGAGHEAASPRRAASRRRSGEGPSSDPEVDAAVQAHAELAEGREIAARLRRLREERGSAQKKLAEIAEQEAAVARTLRDFRATAGEIYRDPEAAIRRWKALAAEEGGETAAGERVQANPALLGKLRTDSEGGFARRAAQALGRATGFAASGEDPPDPEALTRLANRASGFSRAEAAREKPIEWTTPEGKKVTGRDAVREAATTIAADRQREIDRGEKRLKEMGGVRGAEQKVQRSLEGLSPRQKQDVAARVAEKSGLSPSLTSLAGRTVEAARMARTLGEGPAGM